MRLRHSQYQNETPQQSDKIAPTVVRNIPRRKGTQASSRNLVLDGIEAFRSGNIAVVIKERDEYLAAARIGQDRERTLSAVFAAHAFLLLFNTHRAAKALVPLVSTDSGQLKVDAIRKTSKGRFNVGGELAALEQQSSTFLQGLLYAHVGNLAYRDLHFAESRFLATEAAKRMKERDPDLDEDYCAVARAENQVWLARAELRDGDRRTAETTIARLVSAWEDERGKPGMDRVIAIALDLWAAIAWSQGDISAENKAQRSLALLAGLDDPIHLANSRLTNARAYMSMSGRAASLERPLYRLQQAARTFRDYGNEAMEVRARLLEAQCLTKAKRLMEAKDLLNSYVPEGASVPEKLRTMLSETPHELAFAEAEWHLSQTWIKETEARSGEGSWDACRNECEMLVDKRRRLPARLRAEGFAHHGLGLVKSQDPQRREQGQRELQEAIKLAEMGGRTKIKVFALFALAESLIGNDLTKALDCWTEAIGLLATVQSTFLEEWQQTLAPKVGGPLKVEIDRQESWGEAERKLRVAFIRYHQLRNDILDTDDKGKAKFISRATYFRDLNRYKKDLTIQKAYTIICVACGETVAAAAPHLGDSQGNQMREHLRLKHAHTFQTQSHWGAVELSDYFRATRL